MQENFDYEEHSESAWEDVYGQEILRLMKGVPEKFANKVVICTPEEMDGEGFKDPCHFFVVNAFGDRVYLRARERHNARKIADDLYGKDFYGLREVIRAAVR